MTLPYSNATSGDKALGDIQKILANFGCNKFGSMTDMESNELLIQFEYKDRQVSVKASAKGYATAWLKENPWSTRKHSTRIEHERKALAIANIAIYSMLRDWIKGQTTAVETGVLSFEGAFLGQILLENGKTVLEHAEASGILHIEDNREK